MAIVLSLINMKGGVGKRPLAMQLADSADTSDFKSLAVDLDLQSHLSQAPTNPKEYVAHLQAKKPTVAQIFDDYVPAGGSSGAPRRLEIIR